jgi:hypothetical protein
MVAAHDLLNSTRQLAVIRFTLFACPATYVVLATSIAWRSWRRWLLPAAAVTASLCSLPEAYKVDKPAWRELGETLRLVAGQGDAVLLSHANRAYLLRAIDYYTDLRNQYVVTVRPEPSLAVRAAVDAAPRAWLVGTSPEDLARFPAWRIAAVVFEGTTPLPTLWSLEKRMGSPAVAKRPARLRPYWPPRPP